MGKKKNSGSKKQEPQNSSIKLYAGAGIVLLIITLGIVYWVMNNQTEPANTTSDPQPTEEREVHVKGNPDAVNQLVKYSDFGCIHCANLHVHLKRFIEEHGDDFGLTIHHFPINNNVSSRMAVSAALSAGRQGKYWEMVDLLYQNQNEWRSDPEAAFTKYIATLELDSDQFFKDMNDEDMMYQVVKDYFEYAESGISSTPTLYLNGERIPNPRTYEQLESSLLN